MAPLGEQPSFWNKVGKAVHGLPGVDGYSMLFDSPGVDETNLLHHNGRTRRTQILLKRFALFLLPSFISCYWKPPCPEIPRRKHIIHSLDGLRGLACLCVYNHHIFPVFLTSSQSPKIFTTPFLSSIYDGKSAVVVFFIISGYVLSYKPIQLMRKRQFQEFQKTITSSVVRRAIRLCLPPFIAACLLCMLTALGGFDKPWIVFGMRGRYMLEGEPPPKVYHDVWKQIHSLKSTKAYLLNSIIPWQQSVKIRDYEVYDVHIWTIPHELRCSMALFTFLVACARMKAICRVLTVAIFIYHAWGRRQHNAVLFFTGMLLAEFDIANRAYFKPGNANCTRMLKFTMNWSGWDVLWVPLFTVGWYFYSTKAPGSVYLPPSFWAGASMMVCATANSTLLNTLFTNPVSSYLGRISYALYLVHGGIIRSLGYISLHPIFAVVTGTSFNMQQDKAFFAGLSASQCYVAYVLGNIYILSVCVWAADLFCRVVDEPSVRLARRFEQLVSINADPEHEKQIVIAQD